FSGVSTIARTKKIDSNQTRVYNTRSRARMANEDSGPGRNLSMEIDEMKDKMECMVELQSRMETMLKTMGDMLNIHLGAHRAQITNTDTTSDTAALVKESLLGEQ
ncbi:hypothetical protein PIB30_110870, partial [Stylosanthes scabra]|nr:hypothetical protein [Stylosanthes scabra]